MVKSETKNETKTVMDPKIEILACEFSGSYVKKLLYSVGNNARVIVDYMNMMKTEINYSYNYGRHNIGLLCRLSKFFDNKPFNEITRDGVIKYLNTFRKTDEADPFHQWIGTYNQYVTYLLRFFRWLYSPNIEQKKRPKPAVMDNIPELPRKETSIYKPSDIWTAEDDLLFLKYSPSKRDKCYHAISRDLSARPSEILNLKIRDVEFKKEGNYQYAQVVVNGKTGTRSLLLIDSIPYLKDYLNNEHPQQGNPNSPLICATGKRLGQHMDHRRLFKIYENYKKEVFPKLLESPNVLPEDKPKIKELLKKRWNPYVRRHSALTAKAKIMKEPLLKMHGGWTPRSQTHLKYEHWFGNEANETLLEVSGLLDKSLQIDPLRPKQCVQCSEPNKIDAKFCTKCKMVLSYDAWEQVQEDQEKRKTDMELILQKMKEYDRIMELVRENPKLARVKPEVLSKKSKTA